MGIKNKSFIDSIRRNNPYFEDMITRSVYHSNAIEGNTLTYAETYAILYNDNSFKIDGKEPREVYEAINHKRTLELIFESLNDVNVSLNEKLIKDINKTINENIKGTSGYRKLQVFIQDSEHSPPKPNKLWTIKEQSSTDSNI